jgi:hypothetical protein
MKKLLATIILAGSSLNFVHAGMKVDISSLTENGRCSDLDKLVEKTKDLDIEFKWERCIASKSLFPLYDPAVEHRYNPDYDVKLLVDYIINEEVVSDSDNGLLGISERNREGYRYVLRNHNDIVIFKSRKYGVRTSSGRTFYGEYYHILGSPKKRHLKKNALIVDLVRGLQKI